MNQSSVSVSRPFLALFVCWWLWGQCDPYAFVKCYWLHLKKKRIFQMFSVFPILHNLKNKFSNDFMNFKNISFELIFFQTDWRILILKLYLCGNSSVLWIILVLFFVGAFWKGNKWCTWILYVVMLVFQFYFH